MYTYRIGDQRERLVFRPAKISSSTSIMSGLGRYSIELGYSYPIFGPFFPLSSRYLIFFFIFFFFSFYLFAVRLSVLCWGKMWGIVRTCAERCYNTI
ncbi:hypothetical protein K445DRAFT_88935 [Daldinia sp. EC12]|nr:hypothetical protein K445DRAFT_88935 [Daldinia sp. EC12]